MNAKPQRRSRDEEVALLQAQLGEARAALEALAAGQVDSIAAADGPVLLREAQAALRGSEANFRTLIECLPDQVWVHREGLVTYVNPKTVSSMGFDHPGQLLGRPILEFTHPDDQAAMRERLSLAPGARAGSQQLRLSHRDGHPLIMEATSQDITFDGLPSSLVVARDVTIQRELEAHLLVSDRMASIGMLAAGVAHELNNPLTFVIANLDYVSLQLSQQADRPPSADDAADLTQALADAVVGAERVRRIVMDLRTFSRSDDVRRGPVDLNRVLDSTLSIAMNEIRHRARLVKDYSPEPMMVEGNESRLGQVFLNLLVNAAQAIPEGAAEQNEIRLVMRHGADGRLEIEVRDTGPGMSPEVRRQLFTPFFTTKPKGVGTGLGLTICQQIVTAHGGHLEVESAPGEGTVFRVVLPPAKVKVTEPQHETKGAHQVPRGRVLVIDDEPLLGQVVGRMLAPTHESVVVTCGKDALECIAQGPPFDVIFCDLMMPQMSGAEVYKAIAARDPELARRVVFMSGGVFTDDARAFLVSTPNAVLDKPFSAAKLLGLAAPFVEQRHPV